MWFCMFIVWSGCVSDVCTAQINHATEQDGMSGSQNHDKCISYILHNKTTGYMHIVRTFAYCIFIVALNIVDLYKA